MANLPILSAEQTTNIPSILQSIIFQDNLVLKLNAMDTILNAYDKSATLDVKAIKRDIHQKYLDNVTFMRKLKLYSKMTENTETALELFGQDYLTHQEFVFDEDFEKTLSDLNKELNRLTGQILKEYLKGEEYEY